MYATIRATKPKKILEIGTHIGTGTKHILLAVKNNSIEGFDCEVTTLDIIDYKNDLKDYQYRKIITNSLEHLHNENDYDFIVQDGSHEIENVKKELDIFDSMKTLKTLWSHDYYLGKGEIGLLFENYGKKIFKKSFPFIEKSYVTGFMIGIK